MSVVSVTKVAEGQGGGWKQGSKEYTSCYDVEVSDPLDGPALVLAAGDLPELGEQYRFENDQDPECTLRELTPTRHANTRLRWRVTARYSNEKEDGGGDNQNNDGGTAEDVLDQHDEIDIFTVPYTRPTEKAKNITELPDRPVGTLGPVTNSAGVILDPPLEMDQSRVGMRLVTNRKAIQSIYWKDFQDAINSDAIIIFKPVLGFTWQAPKYSAKIQSLGATLKWDKKVGFYWRTSLEIHFDFVFGWRDDVLDRGLSAKAKAGDDDGRGGTISANDVVRGTAPVRRLLDIDGTPISEPVLLDGKGGVLGDKKDPVYITYAKYREIPFKALLQ